MELIRGLHNIRARHQGSVATIGNFDGVHRGHRVIVEQAQRLAQQNGTRSTVIVFEPQPREYFRPESAPPRLTPLPAKLKLLAALGVDQVLCLSFNGRLQQLSAAEFTEEVLVTGLAAKALIVGDDFRFGRDRQGDFAFLQQMGVQHQFAVLDTETIFHADQRISSTRIRQSLVAGEFQIAANLLGRFYSIEGRIKHGRQLGRTLDTPTANISLSKWNTPVNGVYCVVVKLLATSQFYWGVANIGQRPTVNGKKRQLEVHLFDFVGDLYHQKLGVVFLKHLRDEQKFDSVEALKLAIGNDKQQARQYFAQLSNSKESYFDA